MANSILESDKQIESTDVLIIGNGPSAITLSFLLAGHWPYYSPDEHGPHPIQYLHERLLYHCSSSHHDTEEDTRTKPKLRSLMESDLMVLSQGLTGRTVASPVALLMDQLQHPNADFGEHNPSTLKWIFREDRRVNHVVLGNNSSPGGIWHSIAKTASKLQRAGANEVLTLSRRSLMQLPVLEIRDQDEQDCDTVPDKRVPYCLVAEYYNKYVDHFDLAKYFRNQMLVIHLEWDPIQKYFLVDAVSKNKNYQVRFLAKRVVLAKGISSSPKMLNIPGETFPFVIHSLIKLDMIIKQTQLLSGQYLQKNNSIDPILIVGSGLSSADTLLLLSQRCQRRAISIIHIFRKSIQDRSLIFHQLATNETSYPEYHQVFQQMKHSTKNVQCLTCYPYSFSSKKFLQFEKYQAYQECILSSINSNRTVTLEFLNTNSSTQCSLCQKLIHHQRSIRISFVLILIGSNPELDFVADDLAQKLINTESPSDHNLIDIDPYSYECSKVPGLYALGPLVGDNFVRYLQGGSLAVANHIWNSHDLNH